MSEAAGFAVWLGREEVAHVRRDGLALRAFVGARLVGAVGHQAAPAASIVRQQLLLDRRKSLFLL